MKDKIRLIVSITLLCIVVLGIFYVYRRLTRNAIDTLASNKELINILVAASNEYNERRHSFYAILHFNPEKKSIGVTFIPPNYLVTLNKRTGKARRLATLSFSDHNDIVDSLEYDLHITIPFYIELYASDVVKIIDLIEGVNLYVLDQVKADLGFTTGINYCDGHKALWYINKVEQNSIYLKYDRIMDVVLTLFTNKDLYKKYANKKYIGEMVSSINTNLLIQEMISLVDLVYDAKTVYTTVMPGKMDKENNYTVDDITRKLYEQKFLRPLVLDIKDSESIKVRILNGSDIPGLARKMRNVLTREGLTVVEFGTSPYEITDTTVIINQKGNLNAALKVSSILGIDVLYHVVDSSQLADVLVIVGKDYSQ
ncbi:MAG: LCP family protein [Spirochaetes bacterium]|nr:LCP family protein [Spirochaetota bacterium]